MMSDTIRLIGRNEHDLVYVIAEHVLNMPCDVREGDLVVNIAFASDNYPIDSSVGIIVPLVLWKVEVEEGNDFIAIHKLTLIHGQALHSVGTGVNIFTQHNGVIHMRNISMDYVPLGQGSIHYNATRHCAILSLRPQKMDID
jgi:hypothetical protein